MSLPHRSRERLSAASDCSHPYLQRRCPSLHRNPNYIGVLFRILGIEVPLPASPLQKRRDVLKHIELHRFQHERKHTLFFLSPVKHDVYPQLVSLGDKSDKMDCLLRVRFGRSARFHLQRNILLQHVFHHR